MADFIGTYEYLIDDKGRISLPVKLRKHIPEGLYSFVVTKGHEHCLYLFPEDEWAKRRAELRQKLSPYKKQHRKFQRDFVGGAEEVVMDRQNRISIPQKYLQHAGIKKDVLLIGNLDFIELWDPAEYESYNNQFPEQSFEELSELIFGGQDVGQ
jgi:MraZ protein